MPEDKPHILKPIFFVRHREQPSVHTNNLHRNDLMWQSNKGDSVELENSFTISTDIETAWKTILDVEKIAPCMPGLKIGQ